MSDPIYYNRKDWEQETAHLTTEDLLILDERYINTDEVNSSRQIDNLYAKYITMIDPSGYILFPDGTKLSTTENITKTDNIFIGNNNFNGTKTSIKSLYITDTTTSKETKIYQQNNILVFDNNVSGGSMIFNNYQSGGGFSRITFDQFGNITGINDLKCNKLYVTAAVYHNFENGSYIISNTNRGSSIIFQITNSGGTINSLTLDQNMNLSGIGMLSSIAITTISLNYSDNIKIYKFGSDLMLDNTLTNGSIKLNSNKIYIANVILHNYSSGNYTLLNSYQGGSLIFQVTDSTNVIKSLTIDQNMNLSGINDLSSTSLTTQTLNLSQNTKIYQTGNDLMIDNNITNGSIKLNSNKVYVSNLISHNYLSGNYVILNSYQSGSLVFQITNSSGVIKSLTYDQNTNLTGINDLYVQRIFLNNVLLDLTTTNDLATNTRQIRSSNEKQTSIEYNNGRFLFLPGAIASNTSYNPIVKAGDNVLTSYNISRINDNSLTLCAYTTTQTGIRATSSQTELYLPKIMDTLTFSDGSTQTKGVNDTYLISFIQNIVSGMQIVPSGTIHAYLGQTLPTGYLWCYGNQASATTYPNLYNAIGDTYANGRTKIVGFFYLPDLQACFLKGVGTNVTFTKNTPIANVGTFQQCNVGDHAHKYTDRGDGTKGFVSGTSNGAQPTSGTYWTDGYSYHSTSHLQLDSETRPNAIGVNYIIKY